MKLRDIILVALVGSAAGAVTVEAGRSVFAGGAPTQKPLVYSGRITESGAAVTGDRPVSIFIWDDETSTEAAHRRCSTIPAAPTAVRDGRFELSLDPTCRPVIEGTPELWVEVQVSGVSMGRTKIGAVPYALEAQRSVSVTRPVYVNPSTQQQWSLNASYCGAAAKTTGAFKSGNLTGWKAAKALCEAKCGAPTAHMCTAEGSVRFVSTGGEVVNPVADWGWFSSGAYVQYNAKDGFQCNGYTDASPDSNLGTVWGGTRPSVSWCGEPRALLCCD